MSPSSQNNQAFPRRETNETFIIHKNFQNLFPPHSNPLTRKSRPSPTPVFPAPSCKLKSQRSLSAMHIETNITLSAAA
jgi:hypothetical protein